MAIAMDLSPEYVVFVPQLEISALSFKAGFAKSCVLLTARRLQMRGYAE